MPDCVLALTTVPADFDAAGLAERLIEGRLAACVTVLSGAESIYAWEGAIHRDREQQLVIKTTADRVAGVLQTIRARHPYDVPEFLVVPVVDGSPSYLDWVRKSVAAGG